MKKIVRRPDINGLLNLDKPVGITSHDLVMAVRRITGGAKVGHTGTLDPFASGVMILCLGKATKLSKDLTEKRKTYRGTMHLGIRTDTQDRTGKVISSCESLDVDKNLLPSVFSEFVGEIEQVPPMFSAAKYKGKRLYKLARQGITIERKPKLVTIYRLDILKIDTPFLEFEAETSAGTYIRTLCDSVGEKLGVGAHLSELRRTQVGNFSIGDSINLDCLQKKVDSGELKQVLLPMNPGWKSPEKACQ